MEQIRLKCCDNEVNSVMIGKVVKDVSFYQGDDIYCSHLVITFTDETFIYIGVKEDDWGNFHIVNKFPVPIKNYASPPGFVYNGEFVYRGNVAELIRLGIVEADDEYAKQQIEESERLKEEREYQQYLELKKKYGDKEL